MRCQVSYGRRVLQEQYSKERGKPDDDPHGVPGEGASMGDPPKAMG